VGFRVKPAQNIPFILVFLCGLIPWVFFSEALTSNVNSITSNKHLVKKIVFPTEILPIVNIAAALVTHVIMLGILMVFLKANGIAFSLYNFQLFYYLGALCVFSLGLSWLITSLNVFYRDVAQMLTVILNLWFWLTPIVWYLNMLPERFHLFIKMNPMFYIVNGYKNSFIYHEPFWQAAGQGFYFWAVCLTMFGVGAFVFRKLKPEFPDVL